ncbi:glycosyltransferase family 2 protein [Aurantiacibacter sediminis]|uniref:glycosyltransferase family 2 protein n=1 Tax=Aurantiacibacter sediminis TaxID=2793064 RepID=UPI002D7FE900|nr:glycosyltransferase family 2 protein [Aurantiacibacter sediminis]
MPKVSVLVLGYNSLRYLPECLRSVPEAVGGSSYEILFLNNGTDASEALVRSEFPDVRVLASQGNIGFAAGVNLLATGARGEWLLNLNPDTVLEPRSIASLLTFAEGRPEFGAVGGLNVDADGEALSITHARLPSLQSILRRSLGIERRVTDYAHAGAASYTQVETLCGGFFLMRRDLWQNLGGFDESFFLYCEEFDLFKRLQMRGCKAALVRESRVFHDVGSGSPLSPDRIFYQVVASAHYAHKHFGKAEAGLAIAVIWISAIGRYLYAALQSWRGGRYPAMRRAFAKAAFEPASWMLGFNSPGADPRKPASREPTFRP